MAAASAGGGVTEEGVGIIAMFRGRRRDGYRRGGDLL